MSILPFLRSKSLPLKKRCDGWSPERRRRSTGLWKLPKLTGIARECIYIVSFRSLAEPDKARLC
jgi:hypothetical protein